MTRLLVAGGGLIGSRHIAHINAHPHLTLAGVIDPDAAVRSGFDAPGFASIDAVDVLADGIVLATPSDLHADHAEQSATRGWHMLIEKPVAGTMEQADRIVAATHAAGVKTLVGHHRRYHPKVAALKDVLQSGVIGAPVLASLIWALKKPDAYFDVPWRSGAQGSPVLINLVHEVDLLRYLLGEIIHVSGFGSRHVRGRERLESGGVTLGFEGGCVATLAFSDATPSPWAFEAGTGENPNIATTGQDNLRIAGTAGAVEFPSLTIWSGADDWSQAPAPAVRAADGELPLVAQLTHFADVIAGRADPLVDAQEGRKSLEQTLMIERALAGTAVQDPVRMGRSSEKHGE
ncbi:Gfo/Idh/MocA family protein [Sedimentitalea todarodis]|uniref:Gfo/Idh/MocA family oxidoreductase n=1 Tax=Sedimentitalea todarodis TaxID=1631240 RepID=A0ABU3VIW1_9RHOB|nr:Gfo/Idh/MocA family oxidoreductase [Sedimentitalea todarodis]MDU9005639.1 Gfo/Idh/MocA family oxidoreductase [Sedimentitalea todarodis]